MDNLPKKLSTEPYKGVRDFYPEDQAIQNYLFETMHEVARSFGYQEYSASILEPSELYKSKGAENEEMVNDQTYTFTDRGEREVTLRPEMTPTVARMVAAKRRELGFPLRWYSIPNVFRYERTQRGRLREHWQLNVDIFGAEAPYAEAEIISVAAGVMRAFGASEDDFEIRIGSRTALEKLFARYNLSEEQAKSLRGLIDRKNKISAEEFNQEAESIVGGSFVLDGSEPEDVSAVRRLLADLGITNTIFDIAIVRGFDYYTGIVFEIFDTDPNNNRAILGGGRYDNLLSLFGEEPVATVGFGMGDVTLRDFLETRGRLPASRAPAAVYLATVSDETIPFSMQLANELREGGIGCEVNLSDRKLADQIKTADKHKVPFLIVIGPDEAASGNFKVRNLDTGAETPVSRGALRSFFLHI
jgi:histidyl-tRNA synthetase